MNRIHKITDQCGDKVAAEGSAPSQGPNEIFYHEIAQLTKLRSRPHELLSKDMPGRSRLPVSTMKMLLSCFKSIFACKWSCTVEQLDSRTYVSQFSDDGTLFIAGCQGSHIRIYNVDKGWKVKKDILAKSLRWTITDACLSPNQHYLVYASLSPVVHIVNIESAATESLANVTEIHDVLNFSGNDDDYDDFGIFSVKFSTDGRELVAASSDNSIYIYDLEANSCSLRVLAHKSDVNTVCFADEAGHLLYSGSDDNLCKVWDRRCFISKGKAARVLMGHLEGITFIDSRRDGLYFISNGKDQTTKLWDIRKMLRLGFTNLMITCCSTGQKYIYTGSSDCSVYIYDLVSGALVATLDHHEGLVRDCNWHPFYPMIVSSSWDCVLARWEFPGCG
ncbi:PREDICTED: LEC14B homolog [Populus euphratica]|uniref:LEC14B homolog n=1 Tax=Populus euphratica TaxID=75702 RepID=A0AAJ6XE27_POPEU|nr:PREDICTED: LEC14B homolog [Populus euphratica]